MPAIKIIPLIALSTLAACTVPAATTDEPVAIPDQVVAVAASGQNLATARLREVDNCYWYEYAGPVETTLLPLRAANGRPICAG